MKTNFFLILCFIAIVSHAQKTIYVNHTQNGIADGSSWSRAYASLQNALIDAQDGDQIWIAKGTYKPGNLRTSTYIVNNSVNLYGGFEGAELSINERNIEVNATIIDGDIGVIGTHTDNIYRLFTIQRNVQSVKIDGITIQNAYANGTGTNAFAGAIYSKADTLHLFNSKIINNLGETIAGAIYCDSTAKANLFAVEFAFNHCTNGAAALSMNKRPSQLVIDSAKFTNHVGSRRIVFVDSSHIDMSRVVFSNNENINSGMISSASKKYNSNYNDLTFTDNSGNNFINSASGIIKLNNIHLEDNTELSAFNNGFFLASDDVEINNFYLLEDQPSSNYYIYISGTDNFKLTNSYFERNNNTANANCVLYISSKNALIENSVFNNIKGGMHNSAGFYYSGETLEVKNSEFKDLKGGYGTAFQAFPRKKISVKNCLFESIESNSQSSCFAISSSGCEIRIDSSTFKYNKSASSYGCINIGTSNSNLIISNSNFQHNACESNASAAFIIVDTLVIDNCLFEFNKSKASTGALDISAKECNIRNSIFNFNNNHNPFSSGGAITFKGVGGHLVVDSCFFMMNSASMGGAINSMARTTITRSLFDMNSANSTDKDINGLGGAIYLHSNISKIYGCIFNLNTANTGGAIFYTHYNNEDNLSLINNTFISNRNYTHTRSGSLFLSANSRVDLTNNIFRYGGDSTIYFDQQQARLTYQNNVIDQPSQWIPYNQESQSGHFSLGPMDYKPAENTAYIDYGVDTYFNTLFATDLFGNPRIQGSSIDVGAVESSYYRPYRTLTGKVYFDQNRNCNAEETEKGIRNIKIKATPGNFISQTDPEGNYTLKVLPDNVYTISQQTDFYEGYIQPLCPTNSMYENVEVTFAKEQYEPLHFYNELEECRRMDVTLYPSRMRNCFSSISKINITNLGGVVSDPAVLKVTYPADIEIINTTPIADSSSNKIVYFTIPMLAPLDNYRIQILDSVSCDPSAQNLGKEISFRAEILDNETCTDVDPRWDKSEVTVQGICDENERISFIISNIGTGTMSQALPYRIFLYDTLVYEGNFELTAGTSKVIEVGYELGAFRLEAQQAAYFPLNSNPTATVNACAANDYIDNSLVRFTADNRAFGMDERHAMIIGSYDPNEIEVSPIGWGEEGNVVLADVLFTYTIHFQNTGNDTAFTVVLIDSLPLGLDVSTITLLDASHNYRFEQTGEFANVLKWTFNNINLVDSLTDEKGSQGYVRFTILPKSDLAIGTPIENKAYIYFDFNLPIITNTVLNTIQHEYPRNIGRIQIQESIITSAFEKEETTTAVYPNPVSDLLHINQSYDQLDIFNISGELVHRLSKNESNHISTSDWSQGLYLLKLYDKQSTTLLKIVKQ